MIDRAERHDRTNILKMLKCARCMVRLYCSLIL